MDLSHWQWCKYNTVMCVGVCVEEEERWGEVIYNWPGLPLKFTAARTINLVFPVLFFNIHIVRNAS